MGMSNDMLRGIQSDLKFAVRSLRRSPGFTAAAIATIALGVGANTGIFSVINAVLFRDIPAPNAHELVSVTQSIEGVPGLAGGMAFGSFTTQEYDTYRESARTLSGLAALSEPSNLLLGGEAQRQIGGVLVSCNYFSVLEQPVALGRALTERDCDLAADPVVVLGHELWTSAFEGEPAVVGRTVEPMAGGSSRSSSRPCRRRLYYMTMAATRTIRRAGCPCWAGATME
jgi:putative ABC transport system permease protein